jgi:hypothetical protein
MGFHAGFNFDSLDWSITVISTNEVEELKEFPSYCCNDETIKLYAKQGPGYQLARLHKLHHPGEWYCS